jgi:hypothetical protein
MRSERQSFLLDEAFEARIVVVSPFVEAARKQVSTLTEIMRALLGVRQITEAGVEALSRLLKKLGR